MMTETTQNNLAGFKSTPFGLRLQSARESLGLESKDAAAQLRLNEKIILMMETDCYSSDLPPTFLRGYIRAYGKLLQIPDHEIKQAIEPIQHNPTPQPMAPAKETSPVTSGHYFVQLFTYLIITTLIGLVGIWWYTHSSSASAPLAIATEKQISIPEEAPKLAVTSAPTTVKTGAVTASVNLGVKLPEHSETPAAKITETDTDTETNSDNAD